MAEPTTRTSWRVIDLTGQRFGLLTVMQLLDSGGNGQPARWQCLCDCGGLRSAKSCDLRSGKSTHCGCSPRQQGRKPSAILLDGILACSVPTAVYPTGRTGRDAGYQAHVRSGQPVCDPCREAHLTKCQDRWSDLTPEQQLRRRTENRTESARYRANSPEKAHAAKHRRIRVLRQIVHDAKARPCTDCGAGYPYYVMQFDHLRDKHIAVSAAVTQVSEARLRAEIAKCDVVCANCHAERTHQRHQARRSAREPLPAEAERLW